VSDKDQKKTRVGEIVDVKINRTNKLSDTNYEQGNPKWGTARFNNRMLMELRMRDSGDVFRFSHEEVDRITVGRMDPNTGSSPDVDLSPFDALNKGVSRRHAVISRRDGALTLVDLGSPNGTFLNGQKLVPNQPRILRDGDDIRLGHLVMRIGFYGTDEEPASGISR